MVLLPFGPPLAIRRYVDSDPDAVWALHNLASKHSRFSKGRGTVG